MRIFDRKVLAGLLLAVSGAAIALVLTTFSSAEAQNAPPIPHEIAGQEKCLTCHGSQGQKPVPANHSSFDETLCLTCHTGATSAVPSQDCLNCHADKGLSMALAGGNTLSLYVDNQEYSGSIHGGKLICTDCHNYAGSTPAPGSGTLSIASEYRHPKLEVSNAREYSLALYEVCKRCHFDNYTKTLDSVHYQLLASGDQNAPICTDCHGAHGVTSPSQPRSMISQTCSQCHQSLYREYARSVHGSALIHDNNLDVPVCTDCHLSHTIEDPRTASFRLESVQICSGCHSNETIMQKYGISTKVVKTYLEDFHGATVALQTKGNKDIWVDEAVCTDCHGVHDILAVDSPDSPVIKTNLVNVCRNCHPDATENFPSAWLSHYEPTLHDAPAVFFIRRFYWVLIPFIVLGLVAHILIDLWRIITNRR